MYQVSSKKILIIALLIVFVGSFAFESARAEEGTVLSIIGPKEVLGIGAEFPLKIVVDTQSPLNAYQVAMTFDSENLEVLSTNDAGSIIDIMRDQPKIYEDGKITFSGASLHPFEGGDGLLVTVNFRVLKEGVSKFNFVDSFIYLANGKGTKVKAGGHEGVVRSQEGVAVTKDATIVDEAPPSVLNLSITDDPINPDQKLLGFLVKDNSTGVKQTYVQYRKWFTWSDLEIAQNPVALPNNVWAVKFMAEDNTGNIVEKVIYDWRAFVVYDLLALVLIILAGGIVMNRILKKKRV